MIARFLCTSFERCAFLLKGYAGTGKTSLMRAVIRVRKEQGRNCVLLAPTGRAAKVLGQLTGMPAHTVHRYIYHRVQDAEGRSRFALKPNLRSNLLFIVDEASMLSAGTGLVGDDLLSDLMSFVYSAKGSKLILLGDDAQLPPVGTENSKALDLDFLRDRFDLRIYEHLLDEVIRQEKNSGILELATAIRKQIFESDAGELKIPESDDVIKLDPYDLQEHLDEAYRAHGRPDVRVICRSNKSANLFNQQIRRTIFDYEDELSAGDLLMVVKNNYLWSKGEDDLPFIANGELCELQYHRGDRELYDLRFATLGLQFTDMREMRTIDCTALLDSLTAPGPSLEESVMNNLYQSVREDLSFEHGPKALKKAMREDTWLNALQVKFGYAITCHKSQGGQWPAVFVDCTRINLTEMQREDWRWFYTAVTRASGKLYLLGV